ncbi:hypothetical protein BIW11_14262, partial [Tropilaelaps mercedesae]
MEVRSRRCTVSKTACTSPFFARFVMRFTLFCECCARGCIGSRCSGHLNRFSGPAPGDGSVVADCLVEPAMALSGSRGTDVSLLTRTLGGRRVKTDLVQSREETSYRSLWPNNGRARKLPQQQSLRMA